MSKIQQNIINYICTDTSTVSHIHTHIHVCIYSHLCVWICVYKNICACICVHRCKVDLSMFASQESPWNVLLQEGVLCLLGRFLSMQFFTCGPPVFTGPIKCSDQNKIYPAALWGCVSTSCLAHLLSVRGKLESFACITRQWQYSLEITFGVWYKNPVLGRDPFRQEWEHFTLAVHFIRPRGDHTKQGGYVRSKFLPLGNARKVGVVFCATLHSSQTETVKRNCLFSGKIKISELNYPDLCFGCVSRVN